MICDNELQFMKELHLISLEKEGIVISFNDEHLEKAYSPMAFTDE